MLSKFKVTMGLRKSKEEKVSQSTFTAIDGEDAYKQAQAQFNPFKQWKLKFSVTEKI